MNLETLSADQRVAECERRGVTFEQHGGHWHAVLPAPRRSGRTIPLASSYDHDKSEAALLMLRYLELGGPLKASRHG